MRNIGLESNIKYNAFSTNCEGILMKKWEKVPDEINGFKIVKDLGLADSGVRYGVVVCKECKKKFETSIYHLKIIKSCGCTRPSQIKPLPSEINGFKIIKDLGCIKFGQQSKRRVIAECKVCHRHYESTPTYLNYRKHCGCRKRGVIVCRYAKSHSRLTQTYKHMISRCYNQNNKDYYLYGARGISVCKEWIDDRNTFCEWALNNGYAENLTIDRVDSNKDYSPENCRWADAKTQARNTSRNVLTMEKAREIRLKKHITNEKLAKEYNVSKATIWCVLNNKTWRE